MEELLIPIKKRVKLHSERTTSSWGWQANDTLKLCLCLFVCFYLFVADVSNKLQQQTSGLLKTGPLCSRLLSKPRAALLFFWLAVAAGVGRVKDGVCVCVCNGGAWG